MPPRKCYYFSGLHLKIQQSKAEIKTTDFKKSAKNYLDGQLFFCLLDGMNFASTVKNSDINFRGKNRNLKKSISMRKIETTK